MSTIHLWKGEGNRTDNGTVTRLIMSRLRTASPYLLAAVLAVTGLMHVLLPAPFDRSISPFVPGHARWLTYGSAVVEWGCAAGLCAPRTRAAAAVASAVLFAVIFPVNVGHALQAHGADRWVALVRLPLQVPLMLWPLQVRRAHLHRSSVDMDAAPPASRLICP